MRYAFELGVRGLLRHPRTMGLAVATLAMGLAATMTMLTLLSMLSADPLPGLSQHLYLGWVDSRQAPAAGARAADDVGAPPRLLKLADVQAIANAQPDIRQTALVPTSLTLEGEDARRESVRALLATGPLPSMFGVPLLHGRSWTEQEARDRAPVAIIDARTSLRLFGRADGTGQLLRVGQGQVRVVGISAEWNPQPGFYALQESDSGWGEALAIRAFLPLDSALAVGVTPISAQDCDRGGTGGFRFNELDLGACRFLQLWAELPTPQTVDGFRAALERYARQRHDTGAFERPPQAQVYSVRAWLTANRVVPDSVRLNLWLSLGLLSLCMVNVAGLLAARFLRRGGELGVRRVLGASRRTVVVQCLVEAGAAGLAGGLLALPLTLFGLWIVRLQDRGYTEQAVLQPGLYAGLLSLAVAVGLLVGLLPAWRAARIEPALQVKSL
jgi:putative ABC transport system permease protein